MAFTVEWIDRKIRLVVAPGERLLDALDEYPQAGTPFACRGGHCGTCRVRVASDALLPPDDNELATLRALSADHDERLACQVRLGDGDGVVELVSTSARKNV